MDKTSSRLSKILPGIFMVCVLLAGPVLADTTINGAGATFPYPVYAQWAWMYNKETGIKLNYQSIGSGGGIR